MVPVVVMNSAFHRLTSGLAINVGDEGGFAPNLANPEDCLDLIMEAIDKAGYKDRFGIALDVAASGRLPLYDPNSF